MTSDPKFEWDPAKAVRNERKHGLSFEEAATAFSDEHGLVIHDPDHSETEDRFVLVGMTTTRRLVVVCHCWRDEDLVIRIISARPATRPERTQYEQARYR